MKKKIGGSFSETIHIIQSIHRHDSKPFWAYMLSNIIHSVHSIHRFHRWADEENKLGALSERPFTPSRASTDKIKNCSGLYVLKHHPQCPQYPQIPQLG